MSELKIKGVTIVETFAEAFPMVGTRIVITAPSLELVLITGKSHEKSMNYGQGEEPWDEYGVVRDALRLRSE